MKLRLKFPHLSRPPILLILFGSIAICSNIALGYLWRKNSQQLQSAQLQLNQNGVQLTAYQNRLSETQQQLLGVQTQLNTLQNTNQVKKNQQLESEVSAIHDQFTKSVTEYEEILKLKDLGAKTQTLDTLFTQTLLFLSQQNTASASASAELTKLSDAITAEQNTLATTTATIPTNTTQSNKPPGNGLSRQSVQSDVGTFLVDILAADLNTAKVQVVTASGGDCGNNCPVDNLADYVNQVHGFAGVNGPYFCPASYPSCAGKTNSFDTLLMNYHKTYFNSANNVYSVVPAVIFSGSTARFVGRSLEWGRDTGVDAVIAAQPMLLSGHGIAFGGDSDPKKNVRTTRAFIGATGSTVYIGAVHGASVVEMAHVLQTLGLENALNLDDAGSIAFQVNGHYIDGPGRDTPFGIVLVRK